MVSYIQVFATTATKKSAEKIAVGLADKRRAACVQVIKPIHRDWLDKVIK